MTTLVGRIIVFWAKELTEGKNKRNCRLKRPRNDEFIIRLRDQITQIKMFKIIK